MTLSLFRSFGFLVLSLSFCLGCGSPKATSSISGRVTLSGTDVDGGVIRFIPTTGTPVEGAIKAGRYSVENAPIGELKVYISWLKPTGKKREIQGPGGENDISAEAIPTKYNTNTELRFTATEGSNTKDFELQKAK